MLTPALSDIEYGNISIGDILYVRPFDDLLEEGISDGKYITFENTGEIVFNISEMRKYCNQQVSVKVKGCTSSKEVPFIMVNENSYVYTKPMLTTHPYTTAEIDYSAEWETLVFKGVHE